MASSPISHQNLMKSLAIESMQVRSALVSFATDYSSNQGGDEVVKLGDNVLNEGVEGSSPNQGGDVGVNIGNVVANEGGEDCSPNQVGNKGVDVCDNVVSQGGGASSVIVCP
ncbi:hypothetical protein L1987_53823 [Smallanthus sonchifolius]|uniref:Uncharacterized protein n=1 Tax=Smallanthus sonchifolius TaxID=185202 RepID=A0ACB9EXA5_9ASTR|nr:hypothetical protein L1987_53823 [Smallanthus sonchifolius]